MAIMPTEKMVSLIEKNFSIVIWESQEGGFMPDMPMPTEKVASQIEKDLAL